MHEIKQELLLQRAALRLQDIQEQRSKIIDGIRKRVHDFDDSVALVGSPRGIHRRTMTEVDPQVTDQVSRSKVKIKDHKA